MKTLDEVIKAFEYTYENDPITWTYGVDALYYLKEYQRYQNTPSCNEFMDLYVKKELKKWKTKNEM